MLLVENVLYEDNHLIAINKAPSEIVQGDKTGDKTLPDSIKEFLKAKYSKSGNIFCGVIHRLDRPTSGVVLFAKTGKALERMNTQFREKEISKTYVALVEGKVEIQKGTLRNLLKKNEKQNKSYIVTKMGKEAVLNYVVRKTFDRYTLLEIQLETGRHHQIRCQLSAMGHPIKGDVKYGARRSNKDGSICLHAESLKFTHPTTKEELLIRAEYPNNEFWIK